MASDLTNLMCTRLFSLFDESDRQTLDQVRNAVADVANEYFNSHQSTSTKKSRSKKSTAGTSAGEEPAKRQKGTGKQNGYHYFVREQMPKCKETGVDRKDRMTHIGGLWKLLSVEQQHEYNALATVHNDYVTSQRTSLGEAFDPSVVSAAATRAAFNSNPRFSSLSVNDSSSTVAAVTAVAAVTPTPAPVTSTATAVAPTTAVAPVTASATARRPRAQK